MSKKKLDGTVLQVHPGHCTVELDDIDKEIKASICGKMRINNIKLLPGDKVEVEVPYNEKRGYDDRGIIKFRK
ncbi:MAG: translation initiation factor IF-1 [archaeon]